MNIVKNLFAIVASIAIAFQAVTSGIIAIKEYKAKRLHKRKK